MNYGNSICDKLCCLEVYVCIFGVVCIVNCYFNAFLGFCVIFNICDDILKMFSHYWKHAQKCEQCSYDMFFMRYIYFKNISIEIIFQMYIYIYITIYI